MREHREVEVYIAESTSSRWLTGRWYRQGGLIPVNSTQTLSSRGTCTFNRVRDIRFEGADGGVQLDYSTSVASIEPGAIVAITVDGPPGSGDVLWWGYITEIRTSGTVKSTSTPEPNHWTLKNDDIGQVVAREFGDLLDRSFPEQFNRKVVNTTVAMDVAPPANISTGQGVKGNAVLTPGSLTNFVWASTIDDTTAIWSRARLLRHVLIYGPPTDWPSFNVVGQTGSIESITKPEVYNINGLSIGQIIDRLVSKSRGLGWYLSLNGNEIDINVRSFSTTASGELPANTPISITYSSGGDNDSADITSLQKQEVQPYDRIVVKGGPHMFGVTLSFNNGLAIGWDPANETAYKDGASNAAGYSSLDEDKKAQRDQLVRNAPALKDVYRRFIIDASNGGLICTAGVACPELNWDGATTTFGSINRSPPQGSARLYNVIPIGASVGAPIADPGNIISDNDTYAPARVFRYDASDTDTPWLELTDPPTNQNGEVNYPGFSIQVDSIGPGFRMGYASNEGLANNHWTTGKPSPLFDDTTPNFDWVMDYEDLHVSLGVESAQKLTVTEDRPEAGALIRKVAVIERPDLRVEASRSGLITGVGADGIRDTLGDAILRDDYPVAQAIADEAKGLLFRKATELTLDLAGADQTPAHASVGFMIGSFFDDIHGGEILSNTMVTAVSRSYSITSPRTTITTQVPPIMEHLAAKDGGGQVATTTPSPNGIALSQNLRGPEDDIKRDRSPEIIKPYRQPSSSVILQPQIKQQNGSAGASVTLTWDAVDSTKPLYIEWHTFFLDTIGGSLDGDISGWIYYDGTNYEGVGNSGYNTDYHAPSATGVELNLVQATIEFDILSDIPTLVFSEDFDYGGGNEYRARAVLTLLQP